MSEKKTITVTPPPCAAQTPEEPRSQSTHSGHETADYSPILPSASSESDPTPGFDSSLTVEERYEVRQPLGSGGFGDVNLAFDQVIQREVAIKRPGPRAGIAERRTFLREAQLAAKVRHPGIVTVHDVGLDGKGEPFIVYEYLSGSNLKSRLSGKPWELHAALTLLSDLADALAAAHREGLTHRDLKPANILFNSAGKPLIGDFGLAIEESGQEQLRGQVAGTCKYMSPEQIRGESHLLDGRTDLWSLGVIGYELLTGKHPFPAAGSEEVKEQILTRAPRPPRQWNEQLPLALEGLVLKLLERDPVDRFASAAEVRDALRQIISDLNPTAPAATHPTLAPPAKRSFVGLALLVSVVVLAAFAWRIGWFGGNLDTDPPREPEPPPVEETPWPFTDADFRADHWYSLLDPQRGPAELMFSTKARREWGNRRNLIVQSQSPAFLELGRTNSTSYSLELVYSAEKWKGCSGVFLGYRPIPQTDLAEATIVSISELKPGQGALDVSRVELLRGGVQLPQAIQHAPQVRERIPLEPNKTVTITIQIVNGEISRLFQNNAQIENPPSLPKSNYPCAGQFGVFTLGGTCNFQHCRIHITPEEN